MALLNALVWALTGIFTKRIGAGVRTVQIMIAHNWTAGIAVLLMGAVAGSFAKLAELPAWVIGLLAGGAVINAGGQFFFFSAVSRGHVGTVYTTTQGLFIVIAMVAGAIFLDERIGWLAVAGAAAIIGGLYVMNVPGKPSGGPVASRRDALVGLGLGAVTALFWAFGLLTTARAIKETDIFTAALLRNVVPALLYVPVAAVLPKYLPTRAPKSTRVNLAISSVLFVAGFMTFLYSITIIPASLSALISSLAPVFALIFSVLMLKEPLTRMAVAGAGISTVGMGLVLASR